jgi:hypothetical protein
VQSPELRVRSTHDYMEVQIVGLTFALQLVIMLLLVTFACWWTLHALERRFPCDERLTSLDDDEEAS